MTILKVQLIAKTSVCTSKEDGLRLFYEIDQVMKTGEDVILDFSGVKEVISGFLNPAIGSLYGIYDDKEIISRLKFINTTEDQKDTIKLVLKWAKKYYLNRALRDRVVRDIMDDEDADDI